ncbi:Maf family protein [Bacillus carboniphilus]|uniref:dTTP/UTP pyrophosphatase n=1 Tax=Bacillus carboniphilus TaxID=86663 RepID=A0ABY9K0I5_9BACI|nr:Maf family protein [Bacillus carboniphilus]WLR44088.1 Maf family protein [Bacillus carboniphilus]
MKQHLILASKSPRRKELLKLITPSFDVIASDVSEHLDEEVSPHETVSTLSERKAKAIAQKYVDSFVIGADTVVCFQGEILGKPHTPKHAKEILNLLSGRKHQVFTGVTIIHNNINETFFVETSVTFRSLEKDEIDSYIETKEPFDKAGAYGIQGYGALFVEEVHGDYNSVVGLPVSRTYLVLKELGFHFNENK